MGKELVKETGKEKHRWWHWPFFGWRKTKSWRDGFLGPLLTPDIDEHIFQCSWCGYEKSIQEHV